MDCVISYNTYKKKANKYLIDYCTNGGKKITYNKLRHKIKDFENKKHNVSQKQKCIIILNYILKVILMMTS